MSGRSAYTDACLNTTAAYLAINVTFDTIQFHVITPINE